MGIVFSQKEDRPPFKILETTGSKIIVILVGGNPILMRSGAGR